MTKEDAMYCTDIMMEEHELCRGHIYDLENALNLWDKEQKTIYKLDILESAMGYATLLTRHIKKENDVVYPFAEKHLSKEVIDSVNHKVSAFEAETEKQGIQKKYLSMIEYMIKTYGAVEDQHDLL